MEPRLRKITLIVLAVLIVIVISFGVTKAFMKPIEQGGNLTEIALSSCAKIKLTGTSSINLSNSHPMSRNRCLQTTPYSLTITSYCDSYVGFNLYIATLSSNTLDASKIHYILTDKGSKDAIVEGVLSTADNGVADFSDTEKTELNTGLKRTYGSIYKIHNANIALKGNKQYDLYLFVDESVTNETMGQTFKAGVAVKSYDREKIGLEICSNGQNLTECIISYANLGSDVSNIYYHDSSLTNGAGDNSYRYAGANESVNNFVCFGTTESPCPPDNLYRIIGVFGENYHEVSGKQLVKLIKYDYANSNLLGTDGNYYGSDTPEVYYKGSLTSINTYYYWKDTSNLKNTMWSESLLNKTNLNTNYINNIGTTWANKIATVTWKIGGNIPDNIYGAVSSVAYQNEIISPTESATDYNAKIGLMYASDYGFAASPSAWTSTMGSYDNATARSTNWMYMGFEEWTISRQAYADDRFSLAYILQISGSVWNSRVFNKSGARPVFNLVDTVTYASGDGTMSNPIILGD